MPGGVTGYAATNSRVRAMYSGLLTPQEWVRLCETGDPNGLIEALKGTVYGPYLAELEERNLNPRRSVYELKRHLADVYTTIVRSVPAEVRPLLAQLYRHFEVGNL